MKTVQKLKIFSLLMAMPFVTNALDCPSGQLLDVSGTTSHTTNVSAEVQSGNMHLELRNHPTDTLPAYIFDCGIIGKVVETITPLGAPFPWPTKLDHTVICNSNDGFSSSNDLVTSTPYNFSEVREVILNIERGEGLFKNMRVELTALGTVDVALGNSFDLTGQVCLKH